MAFKWAIFMLIVTHSCNCEVLRDILSTIHDNWNLEEVILVYRNNPTLPGWNYFDVPRIQNLSSTWVDVAFLDLDRADLLTHVAVKTFPLPKTVFLAVSIEDIKDILRMLLDPYTGHLPRLHERLEIIISVPKLDYVTSLLTDLYIPIYCQVYFIILPSTWYPPQLPNLYEVYHIPSYNKGNLPMSPTMLAVQPGASVPCKHEELWVRRRDLQGIQLKAGTKENAPLVIVQAVNTSTEDKGDIQVTGFMPEVWNELEQLMNFSTAYQESVDSQWGALSANGQWSGLMGMLYRREIDVAIAGMTLTTERVRDADFTQVVHKNSYRLYFRKYSSTLALESMALMTPWQILVTVLASVAVSTLAQVVALHYARDSEETSNTFTSEVVFFYNFYAICQQGTNWGNGLRSISGKMNLWLVYFCGLVVFNSFSATMISRLAVASRNLPFESMEELIRSEKYQIILQKGSADFEVLKAIIKNFGLNISSYMASEQPDSRPEGIERVCNGNFAFWTTMELPELIHDLRTYSCTPLCLVTPYINSVSMAIVKGLPYQQIMNFYLQKMVETGTLSSLHNRWFPEVEQVTIEPRSIELHQAVPLFLWISLGLLVSIALLIAEMYAFKRAQADKMRKIPIIAGRNTGMLIEFYHGAAHQSRVSEGC